MSKLIKESILNIKIDTNRASIQGSNLNADKNIDIKAKSIEIASSQDEHKKWE